MLDELEAELREGRFKPLPARRVYIPKPGQTELRPLSIPAIRDRVVQAAVKIVLEPIFGVSCETCGGLAGESPVQVVTKQPGSWWPAEGETRPSKRHDKVPLGGEQTTSPHDKEPCSLVRFALCEQGQMWEPSLSKMGECRPPASWDHPSAKAEGWSLVIGDKAFRWSLVAGARQAKAMDGAKNLDAQRLRTHRGMEGGMVGKPATEQERSVSAPALRPRGAILGCPVVAKPINSDPVKGWSAERKSEEVVVVMTTGTT